MTLYDTIVLIGAIFGLIVCVPKTMEGLRYIVKRTRTKKDDELLEKVDKIKS